MEQPAASVQASAPATAELPRGLQVALDAFEEGARLQRERRAAAGLEPVTGHLGMTRIGDALKGFLAAIPWDEAAFDERPDVGADGRAYCATCRGARWLRADRPIGHPDFGRLVGCLDCIDAHAADERNRLARLAGLSDAERRKTFESFEHSRLSYPAISAAARFGGDPRGWLAIYGAAGSGKTHIALAIANNLIHRRQAVRFGYVPDLVQQAREYATSQGDEREQGRAWGNALRDSAVLILDDLGAAPHTPFAVGDFLEPLLNYRYKNVLPTVLTMIGAPDVLKAELSESIGRRIEDPSVCTVIRNEAPQWRGKAA
jgi:DNA replication protein DnaC